MADLPEVSVVVPAWRPVNLEGIARSIAANTDVSAEWILVDDGSGPEFSSIFACRPKGMRLLRLDRNRGQAAARNAGLVQARGSWIKFLDADDQLDQSHLKILLRAAKGAPACAIPFAPTKHVMANGRSWINTSWRGLPLSSESQLPRILHSPFAHHCGALFPRSLLLRIGGYDESLCTDEDGDLLIRLLLCGSYFVPVSEVNYCYIHHGVTGRVSSDFGPKKFASRLRVCTKVEEVFSVRPMPSAIRHALACRLDNIAMSYWDQDHAAARAVLEHAYQLFPGYRASGHWLLRLLRRLAGPSAQRFVTSLWRRLRGRPAGGAQG